MLVSSTQRVKSLILSSQIHQGDDKGGHFPPQSNDPPLVKGSESPPGVLSKKLIASEYSNLIARYNWQWFVTLTFRNPPHPEAADKAFYHWVNLINDEVYGRNWRRNRTPGVYWCKALEYHKSGVIHFHCLLGNFESLHDRIRRDYAAQLWWRIGGMSKIDPINDTARACFNYVAKYTSKGGMIDFSNNLKENCQQLAALSHIK